MPLMYLASSDARKDHNLDNLYGLGNGPRGTSADQRSAPLTGIPRNEMAIKAYREEKMPFPDGTIIARLSWNYGPSEENKAFGRSQSFVAGAPINVQFMVKDSRKYAGTGGWGFAQFKDGKPADDADKTCFACHQSVEARDFVFTYYAP